MRYKKLLVCPCSLADLIVIPDVFVLYGVKVCHCCWEAGGVTRTRMGYSHQITGSRHEIKAFSSKLCDLASQWEPSRIVKKVLTLVRSTTRSGRAYGVSPPENPDASTAQGEAFKERILGVFPDYCAPSFFRPNFEGLFFTADCAGITRGADHKRQQSWSQCQKKKKSQK